MTNENIQFIDAVNYFNSHPHEEDDIRDMREVINGDISTHILTRRMTRRA